MKYQTSNYSVTRFGRLQSTRTSSRTKFSELWRTRRTVLATLFTGCWAIELGSCFARAQAIGARKMEAPMPKPLFMSSLFSTPSVVYQPTFGSLMAAMMDLLDSILHCNGSATAVEWALSLSRHASLNMHLIIIIAGLRCSVRKCPRGLSQD